MTALAAAAAAIGAALPRPPASRSASASSAAFSGSSGACRSAATAASRSGRNGSPGPASVAEGGVDPSRRPERLPGPGERDRVAQRRLVLAPVEQVLRDRRGGFQGEAAAPHAGPQRVRPDDEIEGGQRRAGEIERLGLRMVAKRPARARPGRGAKRFGGDGLGANHRRNRSRRRRLWPSLEGESAPPVDSQECPIRLPYRT